MQIKLAFYAKNFARLQDGQALNSTHIAELDQGFDFYAPQTVANMTDRTILLAWIGQPDLTYPTDEYKWHSMLTMPRELHIEQGKIYQNLVALQTVQVENYAEIVQLDRAYIKFDAQQQSFKLDFFNNEKGETLMLSYDGKLLYLDRANTEQTDWMKKFDSQHYCEIARLEQVEIFFDRSVCEIFLNRGEKAMTSRFFIRDRQNVVKSDRTLSLEIAQPKAIQIK